MQVGKQKFTWQLHKLSDQQEQEVESWRELASDSYSILTIMSQSSENKIWPVQSNSTWDQRESCVHMREIVCESGMEVLVETNNDTVPGGPVKQSIFPCTEPFSWLTAINSWKKVLSS